MALSSVSAADLGLVLSNSALIMCGLVFRQPTAASPNMSFFALITDDDLYVTCVCFRFGFHLSNVRQLEISCGCVTTISVSIVCLFVGLKRDF